MQANNKPYMRHERVDDLIEKELSLIIAKEVEFNPGVLVSITEVSVSKKLDRAEVYVSTLPDAKAEEAVRLLNSRVPFLQHLLLKKLNIRPLPDLHFIVDKGNVQAAIIEKALLEEDLKNQNK
ncbi:MAG: 30S ribosome-binding factor RbfA [Chlamydiota bacterium]|nr:30S ribosome-binding factor RbfA [Chlamydiota bacterium]